MNFYRRSSRSVCMKIWPQVICCGTSSADSAAFRTSCETARPPGWANHRRNSLAISRSAGVRGFLPTVARVRQHISHATDSDQHAVRAGTHARSRTANADIIVLIRGGGSDEQFSVFGNPELPRAWSEKRAYRLRVWDIPETIRRSTC